MEYQRSESKVNTEGFIGRELYDHKTSKLNRECIEIVTADLRGPDNAHHKYTIKVIQRAQTSDKCDVLIAEVDLHFQNGGLAEAGPNGITEQALLAIVLDRLRSFNDGPYRCRENSIAITKIEESLMWLDKRTNDRSRRGVEGKRIA